MANSPYISAVRGAGLGLALGAMLFTITDRAAAFLLMPMGLAVGFALGHVLRKNPGTGSRRVATQTWTYDKANLPVRLLLHRFA